MPRKLDEGETTLTLNCIGCTCCRVVWNKGSGYCDACDNDTEQQVCHACGLCEICGRGKCDQDCESDRPNGRSHFGKPIGSVRCHGGVPVFESESE